MTRENRPTLIKRLVQNGMGMVELHATWVEPRFNAPGVTDEAAREQLREWRLNPPAGYYRDIKQEFDTAGITIFTYYVNDERQLHRRARSTRRSRPPEVLGAKGCVGSQGLRVSKRLSAFPGKHGMFLGLHNHDNLSDPDALNTEASFLTGLAFSPDVKATLDVRHFTAGEWRLPGIPRTAPRDGPPASISAIAGRHNGRSTPFGEGDAPIIELLRMIRDNQWPIVVLLEFEHGTLRTQVDEVQLMFDYCKRALA